jgi:hypothetical protein
MRVLLLGQCAILAACSAAAAPPSSTVPLHAQTVPPGFDLDAAVSGRSGQFGCFGAAPDECVLERDGELHVFVLGDGDAAMLVPMFRELAHDHGFSLSASTTAHCPWQIGLGWESDDPVEVQECATVRDDVYERVLPALRPNVVITMHLARDDPARPNPAFVSLDPSWGTGPALVAEATGRSLDALEALDAHAILVEPMPFAPFDSAQCLSGTDVVADCSFQTGTEPLPTETVYRAEADRRPGVSAVDADLLVCPFKPTCVPMLGGELVYRDMVHIVPSWLVDHRAEFWTLLEATGAM